MDSYSNSRSWAGLRSDLLSKIAKCLDSRVDVLCFRAVCYSWRLSIPLPPKIQSPYRLLKLPSFFGHDPDLNLGLFLTESTIYALQPLTEIPDSSDTTRTWLVKIIESESGKVIIKDPLSLLYFDRLHRKLPKVLNLLDYRVSEICKSLTLEFQAGQIPRLDMKDQNSIVVKVVASSALDQFVDGFSIMTRSIRGNLAIWRMGDDKWHNIRGNVEGSCYVDIAYHNGRFYAIDKAGFIVTVNPTTLEHTQFSPQLHGGFGRIGRFKHLVRSYGNLFRIDFEFCGHSSDSDDKLLAPIMVCKLDEEKGDWVYVEGLDDSVVFIGTDVSFSLSGKDFLGCKKNCVYYVDKVSFEENYYYPGFDACIFDLDVCKACPLFKFAGYSMVFWPPPTWLKASNVADAE